MSVTLLIPKPVKVQNAFDLLDRDFEAQLKEQNRHKQLEMPKFVKQNLKSQSSSKKTYIPKPAPLQNASSPTVLPTSSSTSSDKNSTKSMFSAVKESSDTTKCKKCHSSNMVSQSLLQHIYCGTCSSRKHIFHPHTQMNEAGEFIMKPKFCVDCLKHADCHNYYYVVSLFLPSSTKNVYCTWPVTIHDERFNKFQAQMQEQKNSYFSIALPNFLFGVQPYKHAQILHVDTDSHVVTFSASKFHQVTAKYVLPSTGEKCQSFLVDHKAADLFISNNLIQQINDNYCLFQLEDTKHFEANVTIQTLSHSLLRGATSLFHHHFSMRHLYSFMVSLASQTFEEFCKYNGVGDCKHCVKAATKHKSFRFRRSLWIGLEQQGEKEAIVYGVIPSNAYLVAEYIKKFQINSAFENSKVDIYFHPVYEYKEASNVYECCVEKVVLEVRFELIL
jgi:hypothetical protein